MQYLQNSFKDNSVLEGILNQRHNDSPAHTAIVNRCI